MLAAAATAGAATMIVELAAVRLLAPWFGTSLPVWTNVLAVILGGLALGYALGGRWTRTRDPLALSACVLLVAAALAAALPWLARPVASAFMPEGGTLEGARGLLAWGSFAASATLYLPPAVALGIVQPLWLETLTRDGRASGASTGALACASTLGSLAGCYASTHYLVPTLGLATTFHVAGAGLLVAGVALAWLARRRISRGVASACLFAALVAQTSSLSRPVPPRGARELAARETAYQFARIVEDASTGYRYLQVNEGFDSFQSAWRDRPGPLGEGYYYDLFALPAWWSGRASGEWRVLVLGAGTDSVTRVLEGARPAGLELASTLVEIDERVAELGAEWMDAAPSERRRWLAGLDARAVLPLLPGPFDEIVIDAYANQIEIPPHLCSREFFEQVLERLAPGGWLALNVGGFAFEDPVVAAVAATLAAACGRPVLALRVPAARNFVLLARRDAELPDADRGDFRTAAGAPSELALLAGRLELPSSWRRIDASSALVLTDDRNPIEALQQQSLAHARAERGGQP
ncbi:MAG: hypothetical protein EPO68_04670 [Planctomycetota bacterium]|nr:MAG: hypothetical protein EPO68_04670 [Planctomycetota bacterium]